MTVGVQGPTSVAKAPERFTMRVVATGFASPWEIAWGPDGQLWITEREAFRVLQVNPADGMRRVLLTIHEVHRSVAQDGLLGWPSIRTFGKGTDQVFVAFTYDDAPGPALARRLGIRRYRYDATSRALVDPVDVLAGLPTHDDHVGGRIAVGPDRKLYLTIGDGGANFGGNRCMANHAQTLPTAAQVSAKNWVRATRARSCASIWTAASRATTRRSAACAATCSPSAIAIRSALAFGPGRAALRVRARARAATTR